MDTPNPRSTSASLQGPKIAHGSVPKVFPVRLPPRLLRFDGTTFLYKLLFGPRDSAGPLVLVEFHRFLFYFTRSSCNFSRFLTGAMMSEFNTTTAFEAESEPETKGAMPAEFGLAMATFVVVASMVGTGVLTTSGYTVATVGSNQWMLILWVVGGVTAVCGALDAGRAVGGAAADRRRLRLPVRGVRPAAGVPVGLGLVPDRLRRPERGVGVRLGEVPARAVPRPRDGHRPAGADPGDGR